MQLYVGTKTILATPMSRADYNTYRGWQLPADENGDDEGFLVEYTDGGQNNHALHKGYVSWSPADVFAGSYKASGNLSFGHAIELLRAGHKVSRAGWNGKDMFLYLVPGNRYPPTTEAGHAIARNHEDGLVPYGAYIAMKTAQDNVVPWLASQTDVLAEDWCLVG